LALREACRELDLVAAVERSRSGEGAHVWFFFSEPAQAALARRFGLMLLTDAMARSPTLGMASYDRLFPSQDTLRKHLEQLAERLAEDTLTLIVLHGDMRLAERRVALQQLASTDSDSGRVVLATGRYIGEGFDDPHLDTLLLAMPIAWKGTVVQYAGRLHRAHPGKQDVLIYDYVDAELPVLRRMFAKRLRAYRSLGYELAKTA